MVNAGYIGGVDLCSSGKGMVLKFSRSQMNLIHISCHVPRHLIVGKTVSTQWLPIYLY